MADGYTPERLSDLLIEPREHLNVEIKTWLDLNDNSNKSILLKAIIAIGNHGGGFVIIGFNDAEDIAEPDGNRLVTLDQYTQDHINGLVQSYVEPPFQCTVHHVGGQDGLSYPVIVIPGGHRTPIMAKRGSPDQVTLRKNRVYIRRPGPKSEEPQNTQDWNDLFSRCLAARQEELQELIRSTISGVQSYEQTFEQETEFERWRNSCLLRWNALIGDLGENDPRRMPLGRYIIGYRIDGPIRELNMPELLETINASTVRHTGWPPFWVPTSEGIRPYPNEGTIECWLGGGEDRAFDDPAHSDFWRISPSGYAFLIRGFQEDGELDRDDLRPGENFDVTLPIWRTGEALLQAEKLSENLCEGDALITFFVRYEGLVNRELTSRKFNVALARRRRVHQDSIDLVTTVQASSISHNLPEISKSLLTPLYNLFDFFEPPPGLFNQQIEEMRGHHF